MNTITSRIEEVDKEIETTDESGNIIFDLARVFVDPRIDAIYVTMATSLAELSASVPRIPGDGPGKDVHVRLVVHADESTCISNTLCELSVREIFRHIE